jgi:hypothetical protein
MILELVAIILSAVAVIIAIFTFYLTNIKGPDITLKVNKAIELEHCRKAILPALFINEGGKPGALLRDLDFESPSVSLPKFLKDFGSFSNFNFDNIEFSVKIAPGESIMCEIVIDFTGNDNDKLTELDKLFRKHKEIVPIQIFKVILF